MRYIKLYEKLTQWEWYKSPNTLKVFIHLLLKANWSDNRWQGIEVLRGQVLTSVHTLAEENGLTEKQIRVALNHLKKTNEVAIKGASKYSVITICKYDSYQCVNLEEGEQKGKQKGKVRANKGQTKGKQRATLLEYIEDKEEKNKEELIFKPEAKFDFRAMLIEFGVREEMADEWMRIRRAKKAVNSEFAFKCLINEAEKAGISTPEAVFVCCENQWRGFKAEYIKGGVSKGVNMERCVEGAKALQKLWGSRPI